MSRDITRRELIKISSVATLGTFAVGNASAERNQTGAELVEELKKADDPNEAFQRMSKREQKKVIRYLTPRRTTIEVQIPEPGVATQEVSACKEVKATFVGTNSDGDELYTYNTEINWCYDGYSVSDVHRRRWGNTSALFWEYHGHRDSSERGGAGNTFYELTSTGHFSLCAGGNLGCVQHAYPTVEVLVRSDGSYDTGGDL